MKEDGIMKKTQKEIWLLALLLVAMIPLPACVNATETLVIVTSDHKTGYLTGIYNEVVNNSVGIMPTMSLE